MTKETPKKKNKRASHYSYKGRGMMLKDKNSSEWVKYRSPGELVGDKPEKASWGCMLADATSLKIG